jgi:DNA-binding transcriptional LysR family regulator
MDRLESMSTFLTAVDAGSLSAAARKLRAPLPTVSRKVSELETYLRTKLFQRTNRRLILTEAGRSYAAACRRVLEDLAEAERTAAGEYRDPRGELTITAPIVFGRIHVLPVAIDFLKAYPDIAIRLALADRVVSLQEENVDLAVRIGELPDSGLIATRVGSIRRMTCGSPKYLSQRGRPKRPQDLRSHDCITFDGLSSPDSWTFLDGRSTVAIDVHSRLIVNTAEAALDAAVAGVGLTRLLSYQAADALRAGKLHAVLEKFEPPVWPLSLVYPGQGLLPLKLRAFLDFAVPRLKSRLEQH